MKDLLVVVVYFSPTFSTITLPTGCRMAFTGPLNVPIFCCAGFFDTTAFTDLFWRIFSEFGHYYLQIPSYLRVNEIIR
jgi:hypothetical protein